MLQIKWQGNIDTMESLLCVTYTPTSRDQPDTPSLDASVTGSWSLTMAGDMVHIVFGILFMAILPINNTSLGVD